MDANTVYIAHFPYVWHVRMVYIWPGHWTLGTGPVPDDFSSPP